MTTEYNIIPEWAQHERQQDIDWIQENAGIFQLAAGLAFEESGRGAIVVDTTELPLPEEAFKFGYFTQAIVEEVFDEDTQRMVQEYEPSQEFILLLLKPENKTSSYRIREEPADHRGGALRSI